LSRCVDWRSRIETLSKPCRSVPRLPVPRENTRGEPPAVSLPLQKVNMNKLLDIIPKDFSGAVLVSRDDNVVLGKGFGFSDLANQIYNTVDTKFQTASAGKFFVAVGIMQLIEANRLSLDSQIGDVLDFDLHQIDRGITIRQLLNHTSGIPDYFDESTMSEYADLWIDFPNYRIRKSRDLLPLFIEKPMMYQAGEKFQYNNSGYVVLGLIIESVTGQLFDEYLTDGVFRPCEMLDTGYYEFDRLPAKCANAYIFDESKQQYYTNIYSVDAKGTGAGGAFTTVIDVEKLWMKLLNGNLVSRSTLTEMFSVQSCDEDEEDYYGYGVWLKKIEEDVFHPFFQGSDPGVSFISRYNPKSKVRVHIVSNKGENVWKLASNIEASQI
jgi:CubicO group peptidase (beta-lactamase class C family)